MARIFPCLLFVLTILGCGEDKSHRITAGPPGGPPAFEEGTGTVVLSGRIN